MMRQRCHMVVSEFLYFHLNFQEIALNWNLGMKSSGYGRFGSSGLDEWVRTKTVTFKG